MPIQNIDFILKEVIKFLPLFIPIIIIEYGLMIFALIQVIKNEVVYLPNMPFKPISSFKNWFEISHLWPARLEHKLFIYFLNNSNIG